MEQAQEIRRIGFRGITLAFPQKEQAQMAWYKYAQYISPMTSDEFDKTYEPGSSGGWSGIYRCTGCGKECVHTSGQSMPPQNHHTHDSSQGKILWQLIVTDKS